MGRVLRIMLVAVGMLLPIAGDAGGEGFNVSRVFVTVCNHERYKPKVFDFVCGGSHVDDLVEGLKWSHWSSTEARGRGNLVVSSGVVFPSRHSGPVKVRLTDPITCKKGKSQVFSRMRITPVGKRHGSTMKLHCPV